MEVAGRYNEGLARDILVNSYAILPVLHAMLGWIHFRVVQRLYHSALSVLSVEHLLVQQNIVGND